MNLTSGVDIIKSLKSQESTINWVQCPFCDEEFTKLRPCNYWQNGKDVQSFICIECAETVKGLTYLAFQYPIPGVDVRREILPLYKPPLDQKYLSERSYKAVVSYGDWSFMVWPRSSRLSVLENKKSPDEERNYDNCYQVWFALKSTFEKGREDLEIKKGKWK